MFTQNYIEYKNCQFTGNGVATLTNASGTSANLVVGNSFYGDLGYCVRYPRCRAIVSSDNYCGIYFGSGTTPAQKSDYTLEAPIESGLSFPQFPAGQVISDDGGGKWSVTTSFIVSNTTEETISISEIGVFSIFGQYNASSTKPPVLFERTVLASPVTIAPGGARVINYKVTFNQPS